MQDTSCSQSYHCQSTRKGRVIIYACCLQYVNAKSDGISTEVSEDDKDEAVNACGSELRAVIDVFELSVVSDCLRFGYQEALHNSFHLHFVGRW